MARTFFMILGFLATNATAEDTHHVERRTSVRTALANKMDPNFWPSRGRRSDMDWLNHQLNGLTLRQTTTEEEGPFWANRGRSISDMDHDLNAIDYEGSNDGPFWANRGRGVEGEGPFWANRGRAIDPLVDEGPFWANRGRTVDSLADDGPFWANRGRSADKELGKDKDGPFWANRGRRDDDNRGWRHDRLYVEEPGWIYLGTRQDTPHTNVRRNLFPDAPYSNENADTFWVSRGKRDRTKRTANTLYSPNHVAAYWVLRNRRDSKLTRALEKIKEAHFWPSRGKKDVEQNVVSKEDHVDEGSWVDEKTQEASTQSL